MKLAALVLVSFCVAHTMASPDSDFSTDDLRIVFDAMPAGKANLPKFLEELRELIEQLQQRIYTEVQEFFIEAKQIFEEALAVAERALHQADRYLEKFVLGAINYIESRIGDRVHECLEGRREQLLEILANSRSELRECLAGTENKIEDLKSQVSVHVATILNDADQLKEIFNKCNAEGNNILEQVKCLIEHIDEIRRITLELIYEVRDTLIATASEIHKITSDLKECFAKVLENTRDQVRQVVEEVKDCIEHGPPTTTTATEEPGTEPTTEVPEIY